jgi:hypothetical protein
MKRMPAFPARSTSILLLGCALLCGCAALSEQECRSANWYELGERDALVYGLQPRVDQLAYQCGKYGGVQINDKDYLAGWQVGNWERSIRVSGSECCAAR